jgi:hypothetical protein
MASPGVEGCRGRSSAAVRSEPASAFRRARPASAARRRGPAGGLDAFIERDRCELSAFAAVPRSGDASFASSDVSGAIATAAADGICSETLGLPSASSGRSSAVEAGDEDGAS